MMTVTYTGPHREKDLATLEKDAELARARFVYACGQKARWAQEEYKLCAEFRSAHLAFVKKKFGFTDAQLAEHPQPESTTTWSYAK